LFSCKDLNTSASYPLQVVDYQCLDNLDRLKDHKTMDFAISNDKLFVAKGRRGIDVYSLKSTNKPIANSLTITRDSGFFLTSSSLDFGHKLLFSTYKKTLTVLKPSDSDKVTLKRIDTETFSQNIDFIHIDKYLPYIYVSIKNKGLVVYSTDDLSIKYDYSNIIKNASSVFSTIDSVYLINKDNNGALETYRKTFIGDNLKLNKIATNDNLKDIKILNIIDNKLSYINESNDSVGVFTLSDDSIMPLLSVEHNDSILPKKLRNINDFYYDGFYKVIASDYGLIIIDENNNTFQDLTFYSNKIIVYNDFIITTDDVEENATTSVDVMGRATANSSGIRIYKFGDIFVSKNYGKAPLKVRFNIRSLNLKKITWEFNSFELPSYENAPEYIYEKYGDYNISSTITYNSGKVIKEYIPIKVIEDKKIQVKLFANSLSSNAPFELKVNLGDTDLNFIKNISWDILDGNKTLLNNRKVTSLEYTFMKHGNYTVQVKAEDFDGNKVEENLSILVKTYFKPKIIMDLNRTYMAKDINFSLAFQDSYNDTNNTSKRGIISYKWIFHDGSSSYQKSVIYNYPKSGKYIISAIVKDEYNISYEVNETVEISSSILPNIIVKKKTGESPFSTSFSLALENNYKRYISDLTWELPNGSKTKVSSIAYTFNNEGKFKIKNRYMLSDGLSGITDVDIIVDNSVDADISSSIDYGFAPLNVDFNIQAKSYSGIKSYDIDFGDGNISKLDFNKTNPSYIFKKPKLYKVKLTANSNKNHQGVAFKSIYVIDVALDYNIPEKDLDKIAQSKNLQVNFKANITDTTFVKSFQWFYGYESDKSDINVSNPTYTYKFDKEYKALFKITLENNQTITKDVTINYPTNKDNIELHKGWNLISNPLSVPLEKNCSSSKCIKMSKLEDYNIVWILKENTWVRNPSKIESRYGIWIKVNKNKGLSFYGNRFNLDIDNIVTKTWHLLGNGKDLNANDLSSFKAIYIYNAKTQRYIKNPTSIKASQGFYGIK
jgi:PKD repeat protein